MFKKGDKVIITNTTSASERWYQPGVAYEVESIDDQPSKYEIRIYTPRGLMWVVDGTCIHVNSLIKLEKIIYEVE